eukprot:439990-Hanusia_phi.AAC.1
MHTVNRASREPGCQTVLTRTGGGSAAPAGTGPPRAGDSVTHRVLARPPPACGPRTADSVSLSHRRRRGGLVPGPATVPYSTAQYYGPYRPGPGRTTVPYGTGSPVTVG